MQTEKKYLDTYGLDLQTRKLITYFNYKTISSALQTANLPSLFNPNITFLNAPRNFY